MYIGLIWASIKTADISVENPLNKWISTAVNIHVYESPAQDIRIYRYPQ